MREQTEFSPTYVMRAKLEERFHRRRTKIRCFLRGGYFGPCSGSGSHLQAHHLIPQQELVRLHAAGKFGDTPLSVILSDDRNGILVCEHHHKLLDGQTGRARLRPRLVDLPARFREFLEQFDLWDDAIARYVRPPGHSKAHGADTRDPRGGDTRRR